MAYLQSESGGDFVYICNYPAGVFLLLYVNYVGYFHLVTIVTYYICMTFVNYFRSYLPLPSGTGILQGLLEV